MNARIHDKFRKAVAKNIELWDLIRDIEQLLDEAIPGSADGIDGLDDLVREVACGHDCRESAEGISGEAIDEVLNELLGEEGGDGT